MTKPALFALLVPVAVGFVFKLIGENSGRPMLGIEVTIIIIYYYYYYYYYSLFL